MPLNDTDAKNRIGRREGIRESKRKQQVQWLLRAVIQVLFFIFLPSAYAAAFAGVRYIFTQIGAGKSIAITTFVAALIALIAYTIVFGRFFCGYACAFGSLGDWIFALRSAVAKKMGRRLKSVPEKYMRPLAYVKYFNLIMIALLCAFGIYEKAHGTSPWEVFSTLRAAALDAAEYKAGIAIFVLIICGMLAHERFFCRVLCPMGAVFALVPVIPVFALRRSRETCIRGCSVCSKKCPSDIGLPEDGSFETSADCFQCQKCTGNCPKSNVHCGAGNIKGNELSFTIVRAILLAIMLVVLGI